MRSLKSTGKGACILPHGVLFRGNAEAEIRRQLVRKGYIRAIIGLPANLFYGTGIPACIVVIDKESAHARKGIFMIDASACFMKDGPKNRLRARDIHRIVDTFWKGEDVLGYARMVPFEEIEKKEFNLNLPRYIDSQKEEDRQDIEGHLRGGIPAADIEALQSYWDVYPSLKQALFTECRPNYFELTIDKTDLRKTIFEHPEFVAFRNEMRAHYDQWRDRTASHLKGLDAGCDPKQVIFDISEDLLAHYSTKPLVDKYAVYQHLMDYWADTMQDDCYLLAVDGWKAETYRIIEKSRNGKEKDKGWACDLVPKEYVVARFFADKQAEVDLLAAELETVEAEKAELEEEHSGEDGVFAELDKINKGNVNARLKEIKGEANSADEEKVLKRWLTLFERESDLKKRIKAAEAALDKAAYEKYPSLTVEEIKTLAVDDKWLAAVQAMIEEEMDRISHALAERVLVLAERYEVPLPEIAAHVANLEVKVNKHLERMGFTW